MSITAEQCQVEQQRFEQQQSALEKTVQTLQQALKQSQQAQAQLKQAKEQLCFENGILESKFYKSYTVKPLRLSSMRHRKPSFKKKVQQLSEKRNMKTFTLNGKNNLKKIPSCKQIKPFYSTK